MGGKGSKHNDPSVDTASLPRRPPSLPASKQVRLAVVGEPRSGKSALVRRYIHDKFEPNTDPEAEDEFKKPKVQASRPSSTNAHLKTPKTFKISVELAVVDTASALNAKTPTAEANSATAKFKGLTNQFMNFDTCDGFVLCCSPLKKESLNALELYIDFILTIKEATTWPIVVVMTHFDTDQSKWVLKPAEVEAVALKFGLPFFEASSSTGFNVTNAFQSAVDAVTGIFTDNLQDSNAR